MTNKFYKHLIRVMESTAIVEVTDEKGVIVYVNDKFCEVTGYSKEELLGKTHKLLNSGFHNKIFFDEMWKVLKSGKTWIGEIQNKKKQGELYWLHSTISAIKDHHGNIQNYVCIRYDITQMKKAQMIVYETNRMTSLGEMASGIAHEINNPLTIILGRLTMFKKRLEKNESKETLIGDIDIIEKTVFRISNIVNGLRKLSRDNTKDPVEPFSIKKVIDESQDLFMQKMKKKDINLEIRYESDLVIKGKPLQLSQVLVNLLNNSIDAIEALPDKWIRIIVEKTNQNCLIKIVDSGIGIPPKVASKLMTPFYTTKDPGKGTGLGLSLSKKMIEESNGRFYYDETKPNTTFCIELPLSEESQKVA